MIKYRVRIHDKFSIEFKIWLNNTLPKENRFRVECWIFLPAALDINALTYTRSQFYSDIKNYFRNITPVYPIAELGSISPNDSFEIIPNPKTPMDYLVNSSVNLVNYPTKQNVTELEYQIKMFCAIFKSASREEYNAIKVGEGGNACKVKRAEEFLNCLFRITEEYSYLADYLKKNSEERYFTICSFGEEFLIRLTELYGFKMYERLGSPQAIKEWIKRIGSQRQRRGYASFRTNDRFGNANLLHRLNILKKYVESDLFLSADKRKSGILKEQVWYSIAAGLSMIFATAIAFAFQQKYGNFTMPLFVALVVSYMLKDRIKELVRSVFSRNRKLRYFDNKTSLRVKDCLIGLAREGVDFIPHGKIPQEILAMRNRPALVEVENSINEENILFYRSLLKVDSGKLAATSEYEIDGLNQIILLNVSSFIKKMDNPEQMYHLYSETDEVVQIMVDKIYYINLILQFTSPSGEMSRVRYMVQISRAGILKMEQME